MSEPVTLENDAELWKAVARFFQEENARLQALVEDLEAQLASRIDREDSDQLFGMLTTRLGDALEDR